MVIFLDVMRGMGTLHSPSSKALHLERVTIFFKKKFFYFFLKIGIEKVIFGGIRNLFKFL